MNEAKWIVVAAIAASIAAGASTIQSYVSWTGRNDLLKSTLANTSLSACGEIESEGFAAIAYLAPTRMTVGTTTVLSQLPQDERFQLSLKSVDTLSAYFSKEFNIIDTAEVLNISGALDAETEYQSGVKNIRDRMHSMKTLEDVNNYYQYMMDFITATEPQVKKICRGIRSAVAGKSPGE